MPRRPPARRPARPPPPAAARPPRAAPAPPRDRGPWLYGRHAVAAALANPARRVRRLVALPDAADELRALAAAAAAHLPPGVPEVLDRRGFDLLLPQGAVHQGMALAAEPLPTRDIDDVLDGIAAAAAPHIVVLLDQVTDPHNIGAVLRSAAAFGACAVVIPEHGAPPVTGALAKAASGALEAVPLLRVVNLARTLDRLKEAGFWCLGLEEGAGRTLAEVDPGSRIALVLGAEGSGLRRLTRERCDLLARLPTRGEPRSLNVSNAAAIALYELSRRGR
ncbi:MAG TPA: 23S rRNA (guanosine(2251)-2'-O)-methyltransferase RlmB [Stellaceae bacterium]|nr:23S rRNA (guanosine(2251)-2'-O)-methyltransferase RlmB [Stellaceae bacterium]